MSCYYRAWIFSLLLAVCLVYNTCAAPRQQESDSYDDEYYSDELQSTTPTPENSCDCVCGVPNRNLRIVGGNVTQPNEFPWIVALERRHKFYCGATLVTRRHLLTAAHCVDGFNLKEIKVMLGVHNRLVLNRNSTIERRIVRATVHPDFDLFSFNNDVAIIELNEPVEFGPGIRSACLPRDDKGDYTGRMAVVAGWGRLGEKRPTAVELVKVEVPIMTQEDCRASGYGAKRITDNMLCAGYEEGKKDACQGDSGGPMHVVQDLGNTEVIGVVSWGRGCARPKFPGVYTKVANYLTWIHSQLDDECMCPHPDARTMRQFFP